ncbi:MAG: hypothetical protein M0Z37_02535 [Nitrospiraceae bacterium]|jgi:hypothetical protein|nr:hypothetical protein [Nitrospiraceae bacterium]
MSSVRSETTRVVSKTLNSLLSLTGIRSVGYWYDEAENLSLTHHLES